MNLIILGCSFTSAFGSPSFGPQEAAPIPIRAFNNAGQEENTNLGYAILKDITYFSDGNYLNATYWTYGPPDINIPSIVTYGMLIDGDSKDNTGYGGIDYVFQIQFESNRVTETLEELTSQGDKKVIRSDSEKSDLFQNEKTHIPLSLDLKDIGSPEQYKISFFTNETMLDGKSSYVDYSSLVSVPIPEIKITMNPSQISVSPGEQRMVQVQVQSNSHLEHEIVLYVGQNGNIDGKFTPVQQKVPFNGIITSNLEVTIPDGISPSQIPYPIYARADFDRPQIDTSQVNNILIKNFFRTHLEVLQNSFLEINVQQTSSFENIVYSIFSIGGKLDPLVCANVIPVLIFSGIVTAYRLKKKSSESEKKGINKTKDMVNDRDSNS